MKKNIYQKIKCNICGGDDYKIIIRPKKKMGNKSISVFRSTRGFQQIVRCNKCGLVYVNPRVDSKVLANLYLKEDNSIYIKNTKDRTDTFRKNLNIINSFCQKKGNILDIGTATGLFLKIAKDDGWKSYGVEVNKAAVIYANEKYEANVKLGTLKKAKFNDNFFDVITMWDVLEHMPDPNKELEEIYRILKPGGFLIINYPDFSSVTAKIFGSKWWFIFLSHLFYFEHDSINKILTKNKFEILKFKNYWQSTSWGYLATTLRLYNENLSETLIKLLGMFGLEKKQLKYFAGQKTVIAQKKLTGYLRK